MRVAANFLVAGTTAVFSCSIGSAQIIYSNDFSSGSTASILNTAPMVANDFAGGNSSATWNLTTNNPTLGASAAQNGTLGKIQNSVLLPFTPQAGYVYTLSGSITFNSDPGNWLDLGFGANDPPVNTSSTGYRFNDPAVNGNPWSLFRPGTGNGGVQLYYSRTGVVGSQALIPATFPNTNTIGIVLDTSGIKWVVSESVNGTPVTTSYTYSSYLTISSVGYGQTTLGAANIYQWNYLTLTAVGAPITNNTYWVAPTAAGTGDGSSPANAAGYLDGGFWGGIQSLLQATNVTVNFVDGTYNAGTLNLNDMGNPLHGLTLQAVNSQRPSGVENMWQARSAWHITPNSSEFVRICRAKRAVEECSLTLN